jgi:hypothetical protein
MMQMLLQYSARPAQINWSRFTANFRELASVGISKGVKRLKRSYAKNASLQGYTLYIYDYDMASDWVTPLMSCSFLLKMQIRPRRLGVHCRSAVGDRPSFCLGFDPETIVVTGPLRRERSNCYHSRSKILGRVPEYVLSCCATHPSTAE